MAEIQFDSKNLVRTNHVLNTTYETKLVNGLFDWVQIITPNPDFRVVLYPNPSDGETKLFVNQTTTVSIYNMMGQNLGQRVLEGGQNWLDFHDWPKGIYALQIATLDKLILKRLVLR